jgi:hypothetical protein
MLPERPACKSTRSKSVLNSPIMSSRLDQRIAWKASDAASDSESFGCALLPMIVLQKKGEC